MKVIINYYKEKRVLHEYILQYLENDDETTDDYTTLYTYLANQKIVERKNEFFHFLQLLSIISNNYQRRANLFNKIERIILQFKDQITQNFSNNEIYDIFKESKKILLFLFDKKIITIDQSITKSLISKEENLFFYPEMKPFLDDETMKKYEEKVSNIENFENKRQIGENEDYICELIRKDSIDEFISYVNQKCISLETTIVPSIFETNPFLIGKQPTLLEYATFFGSIRILDYLRLHDKELESSIWLYAIHGQNAEIINILESNKIEPLNNQYEKCFKESIKCHHNSIAEYIQTFLLKAPDFNEYYLNKTIASYALYYQNYGLLNDNFINSDLLFLACKYNYLELVNLLVNYDKIDVNYLTISLILLLM